MRKALLGAVFFCAPILVVSGARAQTRSVTLGVGQSETVKFRRPFTNAQILDPKTADVVSYTSKTVTVVGVRPGNTELLVRFPRDIIRVRIFVSKVETSKLFRAVRQFLGPLEGIIPRMLGEDVIIEGRALTAKDYSRVMMAVQLFGRRIKNFTGYQPTAVKQINQVLVSAGLTTVQANLIGDMVFLEGAVGSKSELEKVNKIIETLNLKVHNLIAVGKGRQVLVEVKFVELKRSSNIKFGLQLPAAITISGNIIGNIPLYPAGGAEVNLGLQAQETGMTLSLNTLFQSGKARLLAKPKLVCGSGEKAKFLVGGEIPIVHESQGAFSVEYKKFGIMLDIEPIADTLGNITAKMKAEVSEPDWANSVRGYPSFVTRRVETRVTMKEGATLILSGLYSSKMSKVIHRFPLLGHIPILGELFKSRDYQREKTNLMVFITTRTVQSGDDWVRKYEKLGRHQLWRFKQEVDWEMFE